MFLALKTGVFHTRLESLLERKTQSPCKKERQSRTDRRRQCISPSLISSHLNGQAVLWAVLLGKLLRYSLSNIHMTCKTQRWEAVWVGGGGGWDGERRRKPQRDGERERSCHVFSSFVFNKNSSSSEIHCTSNHLSSFPLPFSFFSPSLNFHTARLPV